MCVCITRVKDHLLSKGIAIHLGHMHPNTHSQCQRCPSHFACGVVAAVWSMPQSLLLQQTAFLLWHAVFLMEQPKNADNSRAELLTVTVERQHTQMERKGMKEKVRPGKVQYG